MSKKVLAMMEGIIREVFPGKISEELAVALTAVLNQFDIHLSDKCPRAGVGPVELTLEAATALVSKLPVETDLKQFNRVTWEWRWNERYLSLYNTSEFQGLLNEVSARLESHPWIDRLE